MILTFVLGSLRTVTHFKMHEKRKSCVCHSRLLLVQIYTMSCILMYDQNKIDKRIILLIWERTYLPIDINFKKWLAVQRWYSQQMLRINLGRKFQIHIKMHLLLRWNTISAVRVYIYILTTVHFRIRSPRNIL